MKIRQTSWCVDVGGGYPAAVERSIIPLAVSPSHE
jgi:hypothetical protein